MKMLEYLRRVNRKERQRIVFEWGTDTFGADNMVLEQRALRMLEEAVELYQACGASREKAHLTIDIMFSRPPGTVFKELGGVAVTCLALAESANVEFDFAEVTEIARVLSTPSDVFKARNEEKNALGLVAGRKS